MEMYVLDRSTHRRIGVRESVSPSTSLYRLIKEVSDMPTLLSVTKNFLSRRVGAHC
jgi:hypothetical protein